MNVDAIVHNAPNLEEACRACDSPVDVARMLSSVEGSVLLSPEEAGLMSEQDLRDAMAAHLEAHDAERAESAAKALADASRESASHPVFVWSEEREGYRSLDNAAVASALGATVDMLLLPPLIGLLPERSSLMPVGFEWRALTRRATLEYQLVGPEGDLVAWADSRLDHGQVVSPSSAFDIWIADCPSAALSLERAECDACDALGIVPRDERGMGLLYEHCVEKAREGIRARIWDGSPSGRSVTAPSDVLAFDYLSSYGFGTLISEEIIDVYRDAPGARALSALIEDCVLSHVRGDLDLVAEDFQERAVGALDATLSPQPAPQEEIRGHNAPLSAYEHEGNHYEASGHTTQREEGAR